MIEERPTYGTCSKCHEHAEFFTDPYEQAKMSTCCWRPMERPDRDADDA